MTGFTAYKAFDRNGKCHGLQYQEGETYELEGKLELCRRGFHFVPELVLSLQWYPVVEDITENLYAEVEVLGDVVWEEPTHHKGATNKILIKRFLSDEEAKNMVDDKNNSGNRNSGNWNSGNRNSGDWNSGHGNSGNRNSGDRNSGHGNSGGWNSGSWNSCNGESGFFNTEEPETIRVFNKPCSVVVWRDTYIPAVLFHHPDKIKERLQEADEETKQAIRNLPNYAPDVFEELFGVRI